MIKRQIYNTLLGAKMIRSSITLQFNETKLSVYEHGIDSYQPTADIAMKNYIHTHNAYELFASFEKLTLVTREGTHEYSDCLVLVHPGFEHYRSCSGKTHTLLFRTTAPVSTPPMFPNNVGYTVLPLSAKLKVYLEELHANERP